MAVQRLRQAQSPFIPGGKLMEPGQTRIKPPRKVQRPSSANSLPCDSESRSATLFKQLQRIERHMLSASAASFLRVTQQMTDSFCPLTPHRLSLELLMQSAESKSRPAPSRKMPSLVKIPTHS